MSETKRLYILAGNYAQASFWARKWGLTSGDWRYVSEERTFRGLRDVRYAIVGTFYDRSDWRAITEGLKMVGGRQEHPDRGTATA